MKLYNSAESDFKHQLINVRFVISSDFLLYRKVETIH